MDRAENLVAAARNALAHGEAGESVVAVLATEPGGRLVYLCALRRDGDDDAPLGWIAFDADGAVVVDVATIRDAAAIEALCETAEEAALALDAGELAAAAREALGVVAAPGELHDAIAALQQAATDLERAAGSRRVARSDYVDALGRQAERLAAAFGRLRQQAEALSAGLSGEPGDPAEPMARVSWDLVGRLLQAGRPDRFADVLGGATAAIEALADDVVDGYRAALPDNEREEAS